MNYVRSSVKRVAMLLVLVICVGLGLGTLFSASDSRYIGKADGSYITVAHASGEADTDTLIDFYKEKVDKLNKQCNMLLLICILLLVALIVTRIVQPHQSIYEIEKLEKKRSKSDKKGEENVKTHSNKAGSGAIFEDAVNSKSQEVYTIQKEVGEDLRDISDALK